jgi:myosin heavy subunit
VNTAELIKVKPAELAHALCYKTRNLAGSVVHSSLRLEEALALRDSFSKNLYEKLFNYLVFKLNDKIQLEKIDMDDLSQNRASRKSIGILDIFGFEILKRNSLEQFFINFANEKLQQLYVSYIFKEEENEFLKQGLKEFAYEFDFEDNKPIIDLIENYPLGVLYLISESSELNRPDSSLPQTIVKNHPKTGIVSVPKSKPEFFQVNHSCSPV